MPSKAHYSQHPAEVISPMLQSPRRPTSHRMPPSPRRPPSLRIPSAEATYMSTFPESHYQRVISLPHRTPEAHYSQPVIYEASPTFSDPQLSNETSWNQPSSEFYRASPTFIDSQSPSEAIWHQPLPRTLETHHPQPVIYEVSPTFSDEPPTEVNYYPPSPMMPSMSKPDPPRRPVEATMIKGTNVNIGHANMNMRTTQINKPPDKVDGA
jgi:hypothetical protein